jgi:hypothetical protein
MIAAGLALRNLAQFSIELQAGLGVGEGEIAGVVIELVAEHAMVIAELVEDAANLARERWPGERMGKNAEIRLCLATVLLVEVINIVEAHINV